MFRDSLENRDRSRELHHYWPGDSKGIIRSSSQATSAHQHLLDTQEVSLCPFLMIAQLVERRASIRTMVTPGLIIGLPMRRCVLRKRHFTQTKTPKKGCSSALLW